jgi:hypothetical protein
MNFKTIHTAAILDFLRGYRLFSKEYVLDIVHANFHACITKWKIVVIF